MLAASPSTSRRPVSPAPALAAGRTNGMDAPRHRQSHGSQAYPADNPYGAYNPPAVADNGFAQNGYHAANGGGYRPRSPAVFSTGDEGTLSAFLSTLIRSAQSTFAGNGGGSGGSQSLGGSLSSLLPKAPSNSTLTSSSHRRSLSVSVTSLVPSSSTLGFVFLCCLWYLSSAFSSNTGKSILTRFRYPVTLTFIQFAFVAGYCVVVLSLREQLGSRAAGHHHSHHGAGLSKRRGSLATLGAWGIRRPSRHMFNGTFMMSLFQIAGHVFSSMAIARVPVSTVHTIKALSPLFTVLSYAALFGVRYSSATYVALLPLTVGVMLACSFDLRANAVGFLCALGSTFIFVAQNIFSKKLLPKENAAVSAEEKSQGVGAGSGGSSGGGAGGHAKLDKLNLLFYSSGMAFILMIPIWLYSDASALFFGPAAVATNAQQPATSTSELVFFFFANGTVHFAQNLLAFSLLARTSPVTYSIASLVKRIAVICIAIVWSGQHVSFIQAVGMTSTFVGLWMYNSAKTDVDKGEKRRTQVEKRMELSLPQTVGDARDLDGGITPPPPSNLHAQAYGNPLSPTQKAPSYSVAIGASSAGDPRSPTLANGFTSGSQPHPAPAPPPPHSHAYQAQHTHAPSQNPFSSQHPAPTAPSYASPPLHQNGFAPAPPATNSTNYFSASASSTAPITNGASGPRNRQASSSVSRDSSPAAMKTGGHHHPAMGGIQPVPTSFFGGGGTAAAGGAGQLR